MKIKNIVSVVLLSVICLGFIVGTGKAQSASADTAVPVGITLTADELNGGTTAENPWKKTFDFWSNAGKTNENVTYTRDGVVIEGTNKDNAMNLINGPMSVSDGNHFEMTFNVPLRNGETGEKVYPDKKYVEKVAIELYNGSTKLATACIWGDSYDTEQSFIKANFEVGSISVPEIHLPKSVMETGGALKIGFDLTGGWRSEIVDGENVEYRVVSDAFSETLLKTEVKELTRVRVTQRYDGSATNTKFVVKNLNGQNLCLDEENKLFVNDAYNVSALHTKQDATFLSGEEYNFELIGVKENSTECNTVAPKSETSVWAYAFVGLMGDVGWNSDGKKGPEKASGIWVSVVGEDGAVKSENYYGGSWGSDGKIKFSFEKAGNYTLKVTLLTANGYVTVRSLDVTATETPHIVLPEDFSLTYYQGSVVNVPTGSLVDSDGKTIVVESADYVVSFGEGTVETSLGSFTATEVGKYTITYSAEYNGVTYEKSLEINVVADVLKKIEITTAPEKTVYSAGEEFDGKGMVVKAVYESGKTEEISDYAVSKGVLEAGDTAVIVEYRGKKTVLQITVVEKKQDGNSGCGGNVNVAPGTGLAILLVGAGLALKRKKKNK